MCAQSCSEGRNGATCPGIESAPVSGPYEAGTLSKPRMTLAQDLRFAIRSLRRKPAFAALTILTLALGIGLNTAVFSAIEALLLRPLPGVRSSNELVQLYRSWGESVPFGSSSIPHYLSLREQTTDVFSGVADWSFQRINISASGRPEQVMAQMVSANFFTVLGVNAERGRTFLPEEDEKPGAHPVAVISHAAWQGMFGGDPQIVGRTMMMNGHKYTIIGVAPADFRGPLPLVTPAAWLPLMQVDQVMPGGAFRLTSRGNNFTNVIARLKPGVSFEQARDRIKAVHAALLAQYPNDYKDTGANIVRQSDAGIHPQFRTAQVGLSTVVMGVVAMLLLIACVNVANLFLARARDRWREMAVRLSLGADRRRLVRQLLTESLLVSLSAGAVGLFVAWWVIGIINNIRLPMDVDFQPDLRMSVPVLLFTLGVAMVTGVLFGLAPALQATNPALIPALKGESPAGGRSRMSRSLVVAQMALSLVLLVSAGLFLRSLRAATQIDVGFDATHLLLASMDPGLNGYNRTRSEAFYRSLEERMRATPGVVAVGFAENVPLGLGDQQNGIEVPGYEKAPNENLSIDYNIITPGYLEAMKIPVLRGRDFATQDDSAATPSSLIVNQQFAQRFWKDENPLGRTVKLNGRDHTIIGLVPNGKYRSLGESPRAFMYMVRSQSYSAAMTIHVRTQGDPAALGPTLRREVAALDPDLPVVDLKTMTNHLGLTLLPARLIGSVLGAFGILGLILAAVGVYGVMSYSVAQRTREIGIRMAVGAAKQQVVGLVMRQGLRLVIIGGVIGLLAALGTSRLVAGLLYGGSLDLVTFVGVPSVLLAVAVLAIWIPARRAATVDPMVALRSE
jgi:predicted permease